MLWEPAELVHPRLEDKGVTVQLYEIARDRGDLTDEMTTDIPFEKAPGHHVYLVSDFDNSVYQNNILLLASNPG